MDFLDDPFADPVVTKAPPTGRFQPKAKPRPKKGPLAAVRPVITKATKEPPLTSVPQDSVLDKSVQSNDLLGKGKTSDAPQNSSLTDYESSGNLLEKGKTSVEATDLTGSAIIENSEIAGLSTTEAGCHDETSTQNEEELSDFPNVSFASASLLRPCNVQTAPDQSIDKTFQDTDFQIDVEQLEAGDFSCLDSIDITTEGAAAFEKRAVKFQPKPKAQIDRLTKDLVKAASHLPLKLPSENQCTTGDGSIHAEEPDTDSDVLNMRPDDNFSLDSSEYQPDAVDFEDTDTLMPENLLQQSGEDHGETNSNDALGSFAKSVDKGFLSGFEGNENGYELLNGINGGFNDNNSSYDRAPDKSAPNRDENNDGDHLAVETSQKKRPRKSKKVAAENKKPARKRKKAAQELDKPIEKPPKKFPRATRRKRIVDKALLEVPEDELDLQRVPIRDLIILAEYKERRARKEAAADMPPPTSERIEDLPPEDPPYYDDNETYGYDQDGETFDNPSTFEVQKDTGYFNYHSFMTKEPRMRWTKQDTELFYKALSQFGPNFSMIQQLFPGRTRNQIRYKYKNEDPLRLHDALTSRTQDLSYFKLVIKRLEEQAAQDAKMDKDDSVCITGEEEGPEEVLNTYDDVVNSKQKEEGGAADQEPNKRQVERPPKSYYSEEEEIDWSSYKSEL
ncbi:uncharacterized protein [Spinacia oleracea]|uniref:Uncharacterized protein isoform X2 n=1 Tax=Spinacia oleracea TaxID=3562 RepID=A0ABM3RFW2_SPIOL|nr:uncharacterized protein LOC110797543 isoform X2 [Spinacia oleracea]